MAICIVNDLKTTLINIFFFFSENEDGEEAMKMDAEDGGEGYGDAGHDEEDEEEMGKRGITYQVCSC